MIKTYALPPNGFFIVTRSITFIALLGSMSMINGLLFDMLGYGYERLIALLPLSMCYFFLFNTGYTRQADAFRNLRYFVLLITFALQTHFIAEWVDQYDYSYSVYNKTVLFAGLALAYLSLTSLGKRT